MYVAAIVSGIPASTIVSARSPPTRQTCSASATADASCPGWPPTLRSSVWQQLDQRIAGERCYDLPGGGKRMVMPSRGVRHTIVNGVTTYADGALVGASAGKVLRS